MKIQIVIVAFFTFTAVAGFRLSLNAESAASPLQTPPTSSTEPAQSVWDGVYTDEQAGRGKPLYLQTCAACHAADLSGGETAPALAGSDFKSNWSGLTVNDLFERIRTSMPADNAGTLSRPQTADILAYVFSINRFPAGKSELPGDADTLMSIKFEAFKPEPK